jgi:hypothetical protein
MLMSFDSAFFRACLKALNIDNLSRAYHLGDAIHRRGLCNVHSPLGQSYRHENDG